MDSDGVCYVPGVMTDASSRTLYACLVDELAKAYAAVERDPMCSIGRFNVPVETMDPLRGYLLLPLRDEQSVVDGVPDGPLVTSLRELLNPGAKLGARARFRTANSRVRLDARCSDGCFTRVPRRVGSAALTSFNSYTPQRAGELFSTMCGGDSAELYDLVGLRTEPGAARQPIHFDTPYQKVPGLFCAFVALQVTRSVSHAATATLVTVSHSDSRACHRVPWVPTAPRTRHGLPIFNPALGAGFALQHGDDGLSPGHAQEHA